MENQNILIDKDTEQIDTWAYLEIMGHDQIAGRVSERKVGIQVMLQVDVPKGEKDFNYSKLFSPSSIFSILPTTEEWCRKYVNNHRNLSVLPYIPEQRQLNPGNGANEIDIDNFDDEEIV